ncbi:MAG: FtsX-like permease family protein [Anaerocolumna aminovalerica]|uniref:ABC transporter permease n=1 Tax=Anaerocolumna aminovalerica TaxID=1527 RepID=UPI001C0EF43E|nr:FtsX-like permease family protein [Anaerocolumna aminovalerica]MBU5334340.1 FtsX-like permease family protein [Anaerocolumna aminovalerica]MDU6263150.1 FtsX-like permease family protein [Anaerocolumna aminovalerica]
MSKLFYPKLAATNIKKNYQTYVPYILTSIGTVMMYYILKTISLDDGLNSMSGGDSLKTILAMGSFVIGLFSLIFLFYTNSFLIKRRKKEFGLFNILGMEKKHISRVMFFETVYVSFISIILGLLGGIVLSKLMYMLLLKLLKFEVPMGYAISFTAVYKTLILFAGIFLLTFINNLRQIHLTKPIELLKGGQVGEKEPKTKWLLTLIGLAALAGGYIIAITTESPIAALYMFLIAVILVIIGTYCLFTAGSIALLKLLKKNKKYYYKTKHFITVSGMMYRMKQNAVGLANICILSTAVLVMLSTTVSLYIGMEDVLRTRYSRNLLITSYNITEEYRKDVKDTVSNILEQHGTEPENILEYRNLSFGAAKKGDSFVTGDEIGDTLSSDIKMLYFIPLEDYNAMNHTSYTLDHNEIFLIVNGETYTQETFTIFDTPLHIKEHHNSLGERLSDIGDIVNSFYVITNDLGQIEEMYRQKMGNSDESVTYYRYIYGFDINTEDEETIQISRDISSALEDSYVESAAGSKEGFYSLYGGLFFLGIFLGGLFIMATVLIIYYKQISEGYDDKSRFEIMQKVGMSRGEIKKSIGSQVLTVFFLPIVTAAIHIAFAFKVITKLLALLNLTNVALFAWCTLGTLLVFAVFYAIIYVLTAKVYYKIVR